MTEHADHRGNPTPGAPKQAPTRTRPMSAESEALNLRDLAAVVRRNWWVVLGCSTLLAGLAAAVAFTTKPSFRARGVIKLANTRVAMAGDLATENNPSSVGLYSDPLKSQIQLLTSRSIAAVVVDSEPELLRVRTIGIPAGLITNVVLAPDATVDSVHLAFGPTGVTATAGAESRQSVYGAPMQLHGVTFSVAKHPAVPDATLRILSRDAAATALAASIKAVQRPESDVIDVEYVGAEPGPVKRVLNRTLRVFTASSAESAHQRTRQRSSFIQQQLVRSDSLEAAAQSALSDFRVREHMFSGKEKFSDGQRDAVSLDMQRGALASDRDVAKSLLASVAATRGPDRARALRTLVSSPGISANPVVAQLYEQLVRFRTSRDSMTTGRYSSATSNPDVQRLDALIASVEEQMTDAASSYITSLNAKITVLDEARARGAASMDRLPSAAAEELRLTSQVESMHKVGDQLREELQKANIAAAVDGGEVEIVDLASTATSLGTSPVPKILIGALVGLVLGIGGAFVREHMNTTIKRRTDIERVLQLASVGVIPSIDHKYLRRRAAQRAKPDGVAGNGAKRNVAKDGTLSRQAQRDAIRASLGIEAFASLRTHMLYLPNGSALKTVVVTSCAPKDGKSTVSANIAEAYARSGAKVLLIDCDLRRPRLHDVFEEMLEIGLSDVLLGTITLEAAMRPVPGSASMSLLTAGSRVTNPSELIGSERAKEFFAALTSKFDLIVIDSPPVLVVSDAAILAKRADGVLFVVRAGATEPAAARAAVAELDAVGARVIGVVLNDPDDTLTRYDGEYYYTYYNDYFAATA
jgi:capsular exopolysaccharide synthesis family protein